ncbi:hypothetical protein Tco_1359489 [Tanacetum coccineum]
MSSMGELTFFLGLQVKQKVDGIFISQDKYVAESEMLDFACVKTASTPMRLRSSFSLALCLQSVLVLGFKVTPKTSHLSACQEEFLGIPHKEVVNFLAGDSFSWQCEKADIVATLNYEYRIDNESTICIVKNPVYHSKTKHIAIRHHFIERIKKETHLGALKIQSDTYVADLLNKAFDVSRFQFLVVTIRMVSDQGQRNSQTLKARITKLKKQANLLHEEHIEGTEEQVESTDGHKKGTEEEIATQATQTSTQTPSSTIFGDDETIAKVLLNMSQAKAVSKEKEKGVELKDVEETDRPRPTSTRSLLTLKPLPKIDPKDKGKKKIEEEDESESESDGIPEAEKKFKQLESDEEMARKIQEEWEGEEERNRIAEEKAANEALIRNFDDIKARIEADRLLAEKLQEQEREQFTIEERAKFLHDTIAAQRKFFAQQKITKL